MTFVLTTVSEGQLTYSVDGVSVSKTVQRQPLTLDNYTGAYDAIITQTVSGCVNPSDNGTATGPGTVSIAQNGPSIVVTTAFGGGACRVEIAAVRRTAAQILIDEADHFHEITIDDCFVYKVPPKNLSRRNR